MIMRDLSIPMSFGEKSIMSSLEGLQKTNVKRIHGKLDKICCF